MARRVVVTGLGVVSPVGSTVERAFTSVVNGVSGIATVEKWKTMLWAGEPVRVTCGGMAKDFDATEYLDAKSIRRMDRFLHFAIAAGRQAWEHAQLPDALENPQSERAGAILGVGLVGPSWLMETYDNFVARGPRRISPFLIPSMISNLAPSYLAMRYGLRNANWSCVSACASASHAIGEAFMHIRQGRADLMIAGGAESAMHPIAIAGFDAMGVLSRKHNDNPGKAVRPFDRERDGFVVGEGAGVVVLEELDQARRRGAVILAELVGYGSTNDAFHITTPLEDSSGATRAMQQALDMGQVLPEQVGYINANGTATAYNDKYETRAIKNVFGIHASRLMISSTKSMTGHLLGAAGGVEAVFSVLALTRALIPPTINLETPDPECDLDYVANTAREKKVDYVMSNSFGIGGANSVLLFRRY